MAVLKVYVDESGDEGFKFAPTFVGGHGSSRWLILAAVIVNEEDDRQVAASIGKAKTMLWPGMTKQHAKTLHWQELDHKRKKAVLSCFRPEPFKWVAVAFEKCHPKMDRSKFDRNLVRSNHPELKTPLLYNYATRFLFERLSKYALSASRELDVTFENRASLSVQGVRSYLRLLESLPGPYGQPTIPTGLIKHVTAQAKPNCKMLQIADACAGALSNALEPDKYGAIEDSYIKALAHKLHRPNGNLWGYGLKLFPGSMQDCVERVSEYGWMNDL